MTQKWVISLTGQTGHWVIPVYRGGVPPSGGARPGHPPSGVPQASGREAPYTSWTRYHGSMRGSTKGSIRLHGTEDTMGGRSMQRVSMEDTEHRMVRRISYRMTPTRARARRSQYINRQILYRDPYRPMGRSLYGSWI